MRSRSDRRKAAPAPASRAMMILAPPSLLGLRGRTRFFLLRGVLSLLPLEEEDLGKLKSPVLPLVPFSTSDILVMLGIALLCLYSPSCLLLEGCGQGIVEE